MSTTKVSEYNPSSFSMSAVSSFTRTENKNDVYQGKDWSKKFYEFLIEHSMKIII